MLFVGDEVMIMAGKLTSFYGVVVGIKSQGFDKENKVSVRTLDENNNQTIRKYNESNLLKCSEE